MKRLLFVALLLSIALILHAQELKVLKSASADLNGDGKPEKVDITIGQRMPNGATSLSRYVLSAGKASVKGNLMSVQGFAIIDLDTHDRYKEIAVYTPGPSDDDQYVIYWYDGKQLRQVGDIGRQIHIQGNGILLADWWTGNFLVRDKYVLDKGTHKLRLVPQAMYYVGEPHKVAISFPIYYSPGSKDALANLEKGSTILVVAMKLGPLRNPKDTKYDRIPGSYLLIKSQSGLLGWTSLESTGGGKVDLNVAD